jgi:periplasmic divalent cation tolerance protein
MTEIVLMVTTVPDDERAESIPQALVEERLAACVQVHGPMASIYRWKGAIERSIERQVVIKTTKQCVAAVEARLRSLHPYELPELLVISADGGSVDYLAWVEGSCGGA